MLRSIAGCVLLAFGLFSACSGGASGPTTDASSSCGEAAGFCLIGCNVGCTQSGCEVREVAENHQLRFQFSQDVDPSTVDFTTISLKTATGQEPVGQFVVEGATITFIPSVRVVGAATFFGFTPNEEYILTLPGGVGAVPALVSTAGDVLERQFSCTISVSRGIIDIDGQPPSAQVVAPTSTQSVPRDSKFVLRFSEVIDRTPFQLNPTGTDAPVQFLLLPRLSSGECQLAAPGILLDGTLRIEEDALGTVSTLTFSPSQSLPGNRCVEARITGRTRDVAGIPALPQTFVFRTDTRTEEGSITEGFDDDVNLDLARSAVRLDGGFASVFAVGGDGRHGDFDFTQGTLDPVSGAYTIDTASIYNGDANATSPMDTPNGEFQFTRFVIPPGQTVRFIGVDPARIRVRGECRIQGRCSFSGFDLERYTTVRNSTDDQPGQPGGVAGAGGSSGGRGGQQADGISVSTSANDGASGGDIVVAAGHAYAGSAAGTGGTGSPVFPSDGLKSSVVLNVFTVISGMGTNGGGGGGFLGVGGEGRVVTPGASSRSIVPSPVPAAPTAGGTAFPLLPIPVGASSADHFLVGGSGGGGGGSHHYFGRDFMAGAAGAGGGGAVSFRVGRRFELAVGGELDARGGSATQLIGDNALNGTYPAPGGGGSGGSVLIQIGSDDNITLDGALDVRGGARGLIRFGGTLYSGEIEGGEGAPGFYRVEAPTRIDPTAWSLNAQPAPTSDSSAALTEGDDLVGFMSRFRDTGFVIPPQFTRYEVEAVVDGTRMTFSDDPALGVAAVAGAAVQIFLQGVEMDPTTGEPLAGAAPTQWFTRASTTQGTPGLDLDPRTGVRWNLIVDRSQASEVRIDRVSVFFQN